MKTIQLGNGLTLSVLDITICCIILVLLILYIVIFTLYTKLNKKYKHFMSGTSARSLEESIMKRLNEIDQLKSDNTETKKQLGILHAKSSQAYQKVALHKYDAFQEMGGKLSFSLCMMDAKENGFMLTSMHSSREGCYTYVKEIINGEAFVLLSEEEKLTLNEAKGKTYENITD